MALVKRYVRDGKNRLIGSVTSGYQDGTEVARDAEGRLLGKSNKRFSTTRDSHGGLVSLDTADAGLLFGGREDE